MTKIASFLVCLGLLAFISGCSSSTKSSISPSSVALGPAQTQQFTAKLPGNTVTWSVQGVPGGNPTVGMIDAQGNYTAPSTSSGASITVTASSSSNSNDSASAQVMYVPAGIVTPTQNPQVALYTISPPADATVMVQFGQTTNYGLTTWTQPTPTGGGAVAMFIAGMLANTPYHMQAT